MILNTLSKLNELNELNAIKLKIRLYREFIIIIENGYNIEISDQDIQKIIDNETFKISLNKNDEIREILIFPEYPFNSPQYLHKNNIITIPDWSPASIILDRGSTFDKFYLSILEQEILQKKIEQAKNK